MTLCERELDALDSAILRLKIGLGKPLSRKNADLLTEDLVNLQGPITRLGSCVARAIARSR